MSKVQTFAANILGTDYICGDIHGMFELLEGTLEKLRFDPSKDRLFALGDLIDRGPQSSEVIDYLEKPWFHSIMGNHEQLACVSLTSKDTASFGNWIINGGDWIFDVEQSKWPLFYQAFMKMPLIIELQLSNAKVIALVHAQMPGTNWPQLKERVESWPDNLVSDPEYAELNEMLWRRDTLLKAKPIKVEGIDHIFHGHSIIPEVMTLGNVSYIDIGSYISNQIAVINPETFIADLPA